MPADKKLIQRMKNGDPDALRILYTRYKDFLLTLANALLHDQNSAEDALHEVFMRFTRNIATFRLTGTLKAYLSVSIANEARSQLRRRKLHAASSDFAVEPPGQTLPCPLESQETAERLRRHLAALPDEQREVVVLRAKGGLTFKEIAAIQQTGIPTVQGRYRYGIEKLRVLLNGELEK